MHGFEATIGHGAWLLQLAALMLVLAMFGQASMKLRIGVIAAALATLGHALIVHHLPSLAIWAGLLLAVSVFKLLQIEGNERLTRFSSGEEHLRTRVLGGLSRTQARALLDLGYWVSGKAGERLLTEGQPATHLYFLHEGAAAVSFAGAPVGRCAPGDLIGDATATSGAPTTATVDLTERCELWCIWADELRRYLALNTTVRAAIERGLNDALRAKLSSANQRLAESRNN